ncbi:hypothetical protein K788_0000102 [Paraburkholderia caribensis MBA4]|uniref:Uncharacterized protein n=1 Tax=Paraburkholderia caribensis MBA4 TaxID=1323664 RepID=A0A0P0RJD6_9BURK|nr:hypothetical protein [Paraburkholderia caribensis]ALL68890.1 hypothetical protein K788_0000102 [Paraburkholderia caribensis MBA4]
MSEEKRNDTSICVETVGARTVRGGRVTRVSSQVEIEGNALADGAGYAACWLDRPIALVGSRLSNGDTITGTPQERFSITVRDGQYIPCLFEADYRFSLADTAAGSKSYA